MFFHKQTKEVEQVEKFVKSLSITIPVKYEDEIYKLYPTDIYYIETLLLSAVCEIIKHIMYKIDIANIYLGILLHYLLVLAVVLIFGYAFNWVNQLPVYVLAGRCIQENHKLKSGGKKRHHI